MTRPATPETPETQGATPQSPPLKGRLRAATGEDVRLHLIDMEHRHGGREPWTARQFSAYCLRRRAGHGVVVFATERGVVVGYLAHVMTREVFAITRLLVHPSARRRGVGRQLVERARMVAGHRVVYTCLSERETDVLLFLKAMTIDTVGQRSPKEEDRELVVRMARKPK